MMLRGVFLQPRLAGVEVFIEPLDTGAAFHEAVVGLKQAGNVLTQVLAGVVDEIFDVVRLFMGLICDRHRHRASSESFPTHHRGSDLGLMDAPE